MSNWIKVEDSLPTNTEWERIHVKILSGSFSPKVIETTVMGKLQHGIYRWRAGDWQKVTHWRPVCA